MVLQLNENHSYQLWSNFKEHAVGEGRGGRGKGQNNSLSYAHLLGCKPSTVLQLVPLWLTRSSRCCVEVAEQRRPRASRSASWHLLIELDWKERDLKQKKTKKTSILPDFMSFSSSYPLTGRSCSCRYSLNLLFCTRTVSGFSRAAAGQLWAWCAGLRPAAVELGVNGFRSSRAFPWCSVEGNRDPSLSRSSSSGCRACAGRPPRCLQLQTNLQSGGKKTVRTMWDKPKLTHISQVSVVKEKVWKVDATHGFEEKKSSSWF